MIYTPSRIIPPPSFLNPWVETNPSGLDSVLAIHLLVLKARLFYD